MKSKSKRKCQLLALSGYRCYGLRVNYPVRYKLSSTGCRLLTSQQPCGCGKVVMARVRKLGWGLPKGKQDRRRVIRKTDTWLRLWVMRFKTGKGVRFLRFARARTKGCTKTFHWPLISYSIIIILILSCTAGLKWNTGKLYYSTVEPGYQRTL